MTARRLRDDPILTRLRRDIALREHAGGDAASAPAHPLTTRISSGSAALDAALGGGFLANGLNELCLEGRADGALEILLPVLERAGAAEARRMIAWCHPRRLPFPAGLARLGCDLERWLLVRPRDLREQLVALEILAGSGVCALVLAPLEAASTEALRRLQAAARRGGSPVFVLRDATEAARASPAPLRLRVGARPAAARRRALEIEVFKRPGLSFAEPLRWEWGIDALDASSTCGPRHRPALAGPRGRGRTADPRGA